jgi:hypothetical protein
MIKHLRHPFFLHFLLLHAFLLISFISYSQTASPGKRKTVFRNMSAGIKFYTGSYLLSAPKAEYIRDSYANFGEVYLQVQTDGSKDWHSSHHLPQYGIAFLHGNPGSRQYIGNMNALYAFVNFPLLRQKGYTGSFRLGGGPGWVRKPFDIYTNPKNTLIGTKFNVFINMMLQNEIKITNRFFADASVGFMHLSNGGTTLPNFGLNIPYFSAGIRYAFPDVSIAEKIVRAGPVKKITYALYGSAAVKQAPWIGSSYYLINTLQAEIGKRYSLNQSYGGGVMLFYNRSIKNVAYETGPDRSRLQAGVYGSYEHFLGRISLPLQVGFYIYNKGKSPPSFQQFGLRYQVSKHIAASLLLKTDLEKADFIHAGIGYKFNAK